MKEKRKKEQETHEQRVAEANSDADDFLLVFDDVTVRILCLLFYNFIVLHLLFIVLYYRILIVILKFV